MNFHSIDFFNEDTQDSTANFKQKGKIWTKKEKNMFEIAYVLYPHNWQKISLFIKTRNEDEVQNYSYKYFKRLK